MTSEGGSFRDPDSQVHRVDGRIIRVLTAQGRAGYDLLRSSGVLDRLIDDGLVVATTEVPFEGLAIPASLGGHGWDLALEHDIVPMISYAHEWSFEQLRAAAVAHLEVLERALGCGVTTADGSAANVQFDGPWPVFIDVGSFVPARPGQPWPGYRQFCRQFLFPLLLSARLGVSHRPWLRGDPEGPTPTDMTRLFGRRRLHDRDVLTHVRLHAWAEQKVSGPGGEVEAAAGDIDLQTPLVAGLRRTIEGLPSSDLTSVWDGYGEGSHYGRDGLEAKERLVAEALATTAPARVVDLGANDGRFSRLASGAGAYTVAFDMDPVAVEKNFLQATRDDDERLMALCLDLSNPSPSLGWNHDERASLVDRGPADAVIALALVHHLAIGNNVPLERVAAFLARVGRQLVIEWVPKEDSQVQRLLASREDIFPDYTEDSFRQAFDGFFEVARREPIAGSSRVLYWLRR